MRPYNRTQRWAGRRLWPLPLQRYIRQRQVGAQILRLTTVEEAEGVAAEVTPAPRDLAAIVCQVAGNRLPLVKDRRPVPPMILTTETTRASMMKMKALIRDPKLSHSNVDSLIC